MNRSSTATVSATADERPGRGGPAPTRTLFAAVVTVLLATGWAANHFAALMPAISDEQHLGAASLEAIFGIYAVGLLPGLLLGGRSSDALGRRPVAWAGSATALAGTVAMLVSQHAEVLLAGRFIVGFGVGLAISSCTAWASDLRGPDGAATAGAVLIAGFAVGPFAAGAIAVAGSPGIRGSFALAAALLGAATLVAAVVARRAAVPDAASTDGVGLPASPRQGSARALSWAMPLAPWVFGSATLAFVTIPTRVDTGLAPSVAAGTAALIASGASGLIQVLARARRFGPQAGTAGALLAAFGYALTAAAPPTMTPALGLTLLLVLGCASGLCMRDGLIDLEAAAPQDRRGALTGAFYALSYLGFGLPLLLTVVGSAPASAAILVTLAVLASATAVARAARLRRDDHRTN